MPKLNWRDGIEVVGIVSIAASLIFVGLQLKQGHEIALAEQYQARADAAQALYLTLLEAGIADQTGATIETHPELIHVVSWAWTQYDNHFFQYRAGFLDDESWQGLRRRVQWMYDACEVRHAWANMSPFLRSSFVEYVEYVESLENHCPGAVE